MAHRSRLPESGLQTVCPELGKGSDRRVDARTGNEARRFGSAFQQVLKRHDSENWLDRRPAFGT